MFGFPDTEAPPLAPMEARLVDRLPDGSGWRFEPKWDGFRCLAWRSDGRVALRSKSGKPLNRYFPEIEALLAAQPGGNFLLDGELLIALDGQLSFAALQARLHPAASRVRRLAQETPAQLMLFDCLALDQEWLGTHPFAERREKLRLLHDTLDGARLPLSPQTADRAAAAAAWLARAGGALDGVIAKNADLPYRPGERAMAKVKQLRTADCVVGGFRYASGSTRALGSLLLGLYDDAGLLHHVGFTSGFDDATRCSLLDRLEPLMAAPGFTGDAPGGPSRWSSARSEEWQPLAPSLVVEIRYDQATGRRFRHGTGFVRWRPDKTPRQCGFDQLALPLPPAELEELLGV